MKILGAADIKKFREKVREHLEITEDEEEELRKEGIELVIPTPYLRRIGDGNTDRLEEMRKQTKESAGK